MTKYQVLINNAIHNETMAEFLDQQEKLTVCFTGGVVENGQIIGHDGERDFIMRVNGGIIYFDEKDVVYVMRK
jgi:hypothetical protein